MKAYYNEVDPKAAAWIRELIKGGHITDGEVDERDIRDVIPADLRGFDRCHFFAGIGIWDYALNQAGWDSDRQVWTGSCPCQPFSAAGKGEGFDDERHLWPDWFHLISVCRPDALFGEQVSSKDGTSWLDLVYSDLEGIGYTAGALDIPSAGVGAPHIRQRLYFTASLLAHAEYEGRDDRGRSEGRRNDHFDGRIAPTWGGGRINGRVRTDTFANGSTRILADSNGGNTGTEREQRSGEQRQQQEGCRIDKLGNANSSGSQGFGRYVEQYDQEGRQGTQRHNRTAGFWADAEWIYCKDGKYRPTQSEIFPLAYGDSVGRVGLLRGAGNAINGEQATEFIRAAKEVITKPNKINKS